MLVIVDWMRIISCYVLWT